MKNNQYTPLPLSKLIAKCLPELEAEMWWVWTKEANPQVISHYTLNSKRWEKKTHLLLDNDSCYAFTFTDCLRAIEMLDTTGWSDLYYRERQRELLEHYLADHYTIGENTIAYLTELFTKK